jgi:hypothetical protein
MKRNPYVAFSLPLFLWTLSCGDSAPIPPDAPPVECRGAAETAQVWGPWKLDFSGTREECDDPSWNGGFEMKPTLEFEVSQRADADTPGAESLRLARSVEGFRFSGRVEGECVRFDLAEEKPEGAAVAFSGSAGEGQITGEFRGVGPGGCTQSGRFEARFRQAALRR